MSDQNNESPAKTVSRSESGTELARWIGPRSRSHRPLVAEDHAGPIRLVRGAVMAVTVTLLGFFAWSAFARVDEAAVTRGKVIPAANIKSVQHLEGGIVAEILASEGDHVEEGQILVRLESTQAQSSHGRNSAKRAALLLTKERLRASIDDRSPRFDRTVMGFSNLKADQRKLYEAEANTLENDKQVIERQLDGRRGDLASLQDQIRSAKREVELLSRKTSMWQVLEKRDAASRLQVLEAERAQESAQGQLDALRGRSENLRDQISEYESRLADVGLKRREKLMRELGSIDAELAELSRSMQQSEDRVARLEVVSPIRGIIQSLPLETEGGVLPPGGLVAEIVPVDERLVVEAEVTTSDIGFVRTGQTARVKFDTYNFTRFGVVEGQISAISPTALQKDDGQAYYRALISLDRPYVGNDPERNAILPGMTAQADVMTGSKTVLEYMLKPIYANLDQSFRER